jgi:hypothetical protein
VDEIFLHKSGAVRSVGAPAWRRLDEYVTLDKSLYGLLFKNEVNSPSDFQTFFLITLFEEAFIRNVILITILCINNNNNNKLKDPILPFKIPRDKRKNLFEIYRKFGRGPSKRFIGPSLEGSVSSCATILERICKKLGFAHGNNDTLSDINIAYLQTNCNAIPSNSHVYRQLKSLGC